MVEISLDPQKIIGEIDAATPLCILNFVSDLCKISFKSEYWGVIKYMNEFISVLNSKEFTKIELPLREKDENLQECLHFLNPTSDEKWDLRSISDGINHINDIINNNIELKISDILFGPKTNSHPKRINELLIYNLCRRYKYITNIHTSFDEMKFAVSHFLKENEIPLLRKTVIENMKHVSNQNVIKYAYNMLHMDTKIEHEIGNESQNTYGSLKIDPKNIIRTNNMLSNNILLQQRISPIDSVESIILAMNRFNICISEAHSPLKQFKFIVNKKFTVHDIHKYVPIDDYNFCINYTRNPKWYSTRLNWFEELFPIYTFNQIVDFCKKEGFGNTSNITDVKILTSYLKQKRNSMWIYFGVVPYCSEISTYAYKTPIEEINDNNLICIGNVSENKMIYFTLDEFTDYLNSTKIFINPIDKEHFSSSFICKLKTHVSELLVTDTDNRYIYTNMIECINNLENIKDVIDYKVKNLKLIIDNLDEESKNEVSEFFKKCTDMAFYMRGWNLNGNDVLPLKSSETYYDPKIYHDIVCDNVCNAYGEILKLYDELPENIKENIASLRLIRFSRIGEVKDIFGLKIKGMGFFQSQTLMDCMNVSVFGDKDSEDSCIRNNSNWILFTSAWYSYIFGFELKFKFDCIDEIS